MINAFSFEGLKEKVQYEKDVSLKAVSSTSSSNGSIEKDASSKILTIGSSTIIDMRHRSKRL